MPLNTLQQLVADYLDDNRGESYASIGRRGNIHRSTVYAIAERPQPRQTPHPDTIAALARGMQMPKSRVRAAAGLAARFGNTSRRRSPPNVAGSLPRP